LYEKGLGNLLRSRSIFREIGDVRKEIAVSRAIGNAFLNLGLFPEAKQELAEVLRFGEKIGLFNELARAQGILSFMDEYDGKLEKALLQVLKALECIEKTDVKYVQAFVYGALTRIYSKLGDLKRADEYCAKMESLPPEVLSTWLVKFNNALSKGVYFAAKGKFKESNQIFEAVAANLTSPFITDYACILEKQGRIEEAKVQRDKYQKFLEQTRKWFEHVNVHLRVMVPRKVNVGEVFEVRLDLANVSKNPCTSIKVEGLIHSGCRIVSLPSFCTLQNGSINMTNEQINPFQVDTIKIKMSFEETGVYNLNPCLYYTNVSGESRTAEAKPITISVQLGLEEKTSVVELLRGKLEFKYESAEKAFDFLVKAFIKDYYGKRPPKDKSGWRTRMEIIRNAKVTMHSIYGRTGRGGKATLALTDLGLVESRFFLGERGRGGHVLKMRICYEKESVKNLITQQGASNNSKDRAAH
jgi:tetratricopeptide (TPR) repeat protein